MELKENLEGFHKRELQPGKYRCCQNSAVVNFKRLLLSRHYLTCPKIL